MAEIKNKYHIAQSFETLLEVYGKNGQTHVLLSKFNSSVCLGTLKFSSIAGNKIAVSMESFAKSYWDVRNLFTDEVNKYLPAVVFYTQTAIECYHGLVCYKEGENNALLQVPENDSIGMSFHADDASIIDDLIRKIPNEFYLYWRDASMETSYSGKMLLMLSALEVLVKGEGKEKREKILGKDLREKLFKSRKGLRHRLTHGEYYKSGDAVGVRYEDVHKKVIEYFNRTVLGSDSISSEVISPQRNSTKADMAGFLYIESKNRKFDVIEILKDLEEMKNIGDINNLLKYFKEDSCYYINPPQDGLWDTLLEEY